MPRTARRRVRARRQRRMLVGGTIAAVAVVAALLAPAGADDSPPPAAPAQPPAIVTGGARWQTIFADEFDGTTVDASRWNVADSVNYGSGNNEDQCYEARNTTVADGTLRLTGRRETVTSCGSNPDGGSTYYFTSGLVTTRQNFGDLKFKFRQGYSEIRMRTPRGNLYWPAFWLAGAADGSSPAWPAYGEMDITEIYGAHPDVTESNFHRTGGNIGAGAYNVVTGTGDPGIDVNPPNPLVAGGTNDWHTYGLNWTADRLQWFVDGVLVRTYVAATPDDVAALGYEHSIILNLALGGSGAMDAGYTGNETRRNGYGDGNLSADLPGTLEVDWVRVWQPAPPPVADTVTSPADGALVPDGATTFAGTCTASAGPVTVSLGGPSTITATTPCDGGGWSTVLDVPDGTWSVSAAQAADGSDTSATSWFTVDTVAPTVTIDTPVAGSVLSSATTQLGGQCTTGDGPVAVDVTGAAAGSTTTACTDGAWSASIDLDDGIYAATATQTDAADHTGTSAAAGFSVDSTTPVTTDDTATFGDGWLTVPVTVTLTPSDGGAGVAATYFTTDGSLPDTTSPSGTSIALTEDGAYTIRYFSVDRLGNAEPIRTAGTRIHIDRQAPTTTDDSASIGGGWTNRDQTLHLTAADAVAGVAGTYYSTDGSTPTTASAQGTSVVLSTPGSYTVRYFSVDAAGNAEPVHTAGTTIRIDKTAPVTTDNTATIGTAWKTTAQTVNLTPSDATSGVAATYFTTDGSTPTTASAQGRSVVLSTPGSYTVRYFSVDAAGNAEAVRTAGTTIRVDGAPPTVGVMFPADGGRYNSSSWSGGCPSSARLCGTAADAGSGVANVKLTIRRSSDNRYWTGSTWSTSSSSSVTASGTTSWNTPLSTSQLTNGVSYTVTAKANDTAGNVSSVVTRTFTYDTSGPTVGASGLVTTNKNGAINATLDTFSVTFNEALNPASVAATGTLTLSRSSRNTSYGISGLTNGLRDTGSTGYLSSSSQTRTVTFAGSFTLSTDGRTVTFKVTGGCTGSCSSLSTTPRSGPFQYVPATSLRDLAGNAPSTSTVTASSQVLF